MARTRRRAGVRGPYKHRQQWRVYVVGDGGEENYLSYETRQEAAEVVRSLKRELGQEATRTVGEALTEYEEYLRDDKGNKSSSHVTTLSRLRVFFPDQELPLTSLDPAKCGRYYEALTARITRTGKLMAVDTHRNMLAEARTFLRWTVKKRWLKRNPLEQVEGKGRRRHGKPQLRIDEARAWTEKAVELAAAGQDGAVAAMMSFLMGLRCSEIVDRVVRDLDDEGRLLWIPDAKTEAGKRTQEVPEVLRPYLLELAKGKEPSAPIFATKRAPQRTRNWPRKWVQRICGKAGVMQVTAHGMRGLHSTVAIARGVTAHVVAAAMGHESERTTLQSYTAPSALPNVQQAQVLRVLAGGKQ